MKPVFYVIAAIMVLAALLLVLLPLLRTTSPSRRPLGLVLAILIVLPLATFGIYRQVGQPSTLNGVPRQDPAQQQLVQALSQLETHLQQQPDDVAGWLLLAQTLAAVHQAPAALDAYQHALEHDPNNVPAMVGWAEMSAMTRPDHLLAGQARQWLDKAAALDPDNQRALWLLGISDYQQAQFAAAIAHWQRLQPMLPADSKIAAAVASQIQDAQQRLQGSPDPASSTSASNAVELPVQVTISPALAAKVRPGDRLFIYARASTGPAMPLAVTQAAASALPLTVRLTEAMAMLPQHSLAGASHVFVGARISHDGQALAEAGDLEGETAQITLPVSQAVHVEINKVH